MRPANSALAAVSAACHSACRSACHSACHSACRARRRLLAFGEVRVGLFGDIHGNLVSLEAVLASLQQDSPDTLVCLGDIATTGPRPHEVVQRIRDLSCPVILGNWDAWMVEVREGRRPLEGAREIDRWSAAQMTDGDLDFLRSFVPSLEVELDGPDSLFCFHGSPRDFNERIYATTPDDELARAMDGHRARVMAGGHTHVSMLRRFRDDYLLNPGSLSECWNDVARPGRRMVSPWAEYALVDSSRGSVRICLQRVPVDVDAVIASAFESDMAGAEAWTATWVRP